MSDIVERLRELEAVESELACECDCPPEATANYRYAMTCAEAAAEIERLRAALEEGMTSPDEREDCTGLEDSSTANPRGREDCEEEEHMIDKNKTYKTRDGREVRIYAVDVKDEWPVHGAVRNEDGWHPVAWMRDGRWSYQDTLTDLIEVKPRIKRDVWVNVYPARVCSDKVYSTREASDQAAFDRIACVRLTIDCEEGEGL